MFPELPDTILARAALALIIALIGLAFYAGLNRLLLARVRHSKAGADLLPARPGIPTVVYFTTPDCAPCRTVQRPALNALQAQMRGRLQVIEIDASARPDLASRWGVLSVPTTFILDAGGQVRHVNHGSTRADKLSQQIESLN